MQPGYYSYIVNGILRAADQLQHNVTLFTHSIFPAEPQQSLRVYCDGRCDGLMVLTPHANSNLVAALHERGTPFVLIGDTGDSEAISYVDIDNIGAGSRLTEYLIAKGHRRIAFIGGPDKFVRSVGQRYEGFCRAMAAHALTVDPAFVFMGNHREAEVMQEVVEKMRSAGAERPTAIFAWNDRVAAQAVVAMQGLGLRVPDDVSILGIDDDVMAAASSPPLTTLRQPYDAISRRVVEILVAQIRGAVTTPQRAFLPTEFVERVSVADLG